MERGSVEETLALTQGFEALGTLLIMLSGLLFIVGATRIAKHFIFLGIFAVIFAGFHPLLFEAVPLPLLLVASILIVLALLGQFLSLFIGKGAADVAIGNLVSYLITTIAVFMFLPLKFLRKLFGNGP